MSAQQLVNHVYRRVPLIQFTHGLRRIAQYLLITIIERFYFKTKFTEIKDKEAAVAQVFAPIVKKEDEPRTTTTQSLAQPIKTTVSTGATQRRSVEFTGLPAKYQRKPVSSDELNAINV